HRRKCVGRSVSKNLGRLLFKRIQRIIDTWLIVNADIRYWQFLSGSVTATGAYTKATYTFIYDCNASKEYFDKITVPETL
ncbi:MAG: hypothetical protein IJL71_06175, partial [Oscillospiraceae bacterium]|nr:hypothetical protein [Oscillospiraceae bacterium]